MLCKFQVMRLKKCPSIYPGLKDNAIIRVVQIGRLLRVVYNP